MAVGWNAAIPGAHARVSPDADALTGDMPTFVNIWRLHPPQWPVVQAGDAAVVASTPYSVGLAGTYLLAYVDFYYNKVWFLPPVVDFGAVTDAAVAGTYLWNAHLSPITLDAVAEFNATGLTKLGGDPPVEFRQLEYRRYDFSASISGPPTINATYSFTFSSGETYPLPVIGQRSKVAPLVPNWGKAGFTINYQFKTEMFTSRNGREQRRALRAEPRKSVEFTATPAGADFTFFKQVMAGWHNYTILMPEYPRHFELVEPLLAGQTDISMADIPYWAQEGTNVILSYQKRLEARRVSAAGGGVLTIEGGDGLADWPVGTNIYYAISGRYAATLSSNDLTNNVAEINATMDVTPGAEARFALPDADTLYNGVEVLLTKPNWASSISREFQSEREIVDYDRNRMAVFTPQPFASNVTKMTYLARNFSEAEKILNLFRRMKGQRGEFWCPTFEQDILLKQETPADTRSLRIAGQSFAKEYGGSRIYSAIYVELFSGGPLLRLVEQIVAVSDNNGADSVLTVDEDFPIPLNDDTVKYISWMPISRFATDTLQLEWLTDQVCEYQLSIKALERFPKDVV